MKTHIAREVVLLAQDGLIPVELGFELRDQLLDALLVRRQPAVRLVHSFRNDAGRNRIKLRILDARRLLEFCVGLGIGGDQLGPRPERRDVAADGARFVQLEAVVLLLKMLSENTPERWWRRGRGGRVTGRTAM